MAGTWYQVPGTRFLVPGTWYLVPGAWLSALCTSWASSAAAAAAKDLRPQIVSGLAQIYHTLQASEEFFIFLAGFLGPMARPIWPVPGTRYLVPGAWYQAPGTWYQVPGCLLSAHLGHVPQQRRQLRL